MATLTERAYRVAYVDTNKPEEYIRHTLSPCGEIQGIYPFRSGDRRSSTHFFVEFTQQAGLKRARALHLHEANVQVLAFLPELVAHFDAIAPPVRAKKERLDSDDLPQRPWATGKFTPRSWSKSKSKPVRRGGRKAPRTSSGLQPLFRSSPTDTSGWTRRSRDPSGSGLIQDNKENYGGQQQAGSSASMLPTPLHSFERLHTSGADNTPNRSSLNSVVVSIKSESNSPSPDVLSTCSNVAANSPATHPTPEASVRPSINLAYGGNRFTCNLDQLTEDLEGAISLLRQTCASALERDKWMIVAGYYRCKGNIQAAITVVSTMLKVLLAPTVGLSEAHLRPAFLMLSSCHKDLSKQVDDDLAKEHISKAQEYLGKVYGADIPRENEVSHVSAASNLSGITTSHMGRLTDASNHVEGTSSSSGLDCRQASSSLETIQADSHVRVVQCDRQSSNTAYLSQARAAKRRLEKELDTERSFRRKVERDLQNAVQELSSARRGETCALDQCKREVDSRRRVEDRVVQLRDETTVLKRQLDGKVKEVGEKDQQVRECFNRIGTAFLKASTGELDETFVYARGWLLPPTTSGSASMPPPSSVVRTQRSGSVSSRTMDSDMVRTVGR